MSNEAITWAFKQEGLTMTEKFVLIALADYANESHMCFPAHEKTAKRVAASKSTVQRAVKGLEDKGLLRVVSWHRPNGSTTSNRYQLRVGGHYDHGGVVNLTTGGSQSDTRAGYPDDQGAMVTSDHPITPSSYPPDEPPGKNVQPPSGGSRNPDPPGFDDWWKHYPRKEAKGDARKAFKAALRKTDLATLVAATKRYATEVRGTERKFQKLPGGWLRDERWLDYGPQPADVTDEQVVELLGPDNWQPDTSGMSFATVDEEMKYRRRVLAERHEARRDEARRMLEAAGS